MQCEYMISFVTKLSAIFNTNFIVGIEFYLSQNLVILKLVQTNSTAYFLGKKDLKINDSSCLIQLKVKGLDLKISI